MPNFFLILGAFSLLATAEAADRARDIERDLNIVVQQMRLLVEKDIKLLLKDLDPKAQGEFEAKVSQLKTSAGQLDRQFAAKIPSSLKPKESP